MRKAMNSLLRRVIPMALALIVALGTVPGLDQVFAASEEYTYTVRIFAGNMGKIDGKDVIVIDNIKYNGTVDFQAQKRVTVTDDKYYVKGVRESGRDNDEVGVIGPVTRDIDYVIAYGIEGPSVAYTVNYQDEDGNTLAESDTFYGNVGDSPAVAYRYIDGYLPQVASFTDVELDEDDSKNVFTFKYEPIESSSEVEVTQPAAPAKSTTKTGDTSTRTSSSGSKSGSSTSSAAANAGDDVDRAAAGEETVEESSGITAPQEASDEADESEEPAESSEARSEDETAAASEETAANIDDGNTTKASGMSTPAKVGMGVGGAGALGLIFWFLLKKKQ